MIVSYSDYLEAGYKVGYKLVRNFITSRLPAIFSLVMNPSECTIAILIDPNRSYLCEISKISHFLFSYRPIHSYLQDYKIGYIDPSGYNVIYLTKHVPYMKKATYMLIDSKEEGFLYSLIDPHNDLVFHSSADTNEVIGRAIQHVLAGAIDLGKQSSISLIIDLKGVGFRSFEISAK